MLTIQDIQDVLIYEPDTGMFYWKHRPLSHFPDERIMKSWNTRHAGKRAGNKICNGYIQIFIQGRLHYAHKIAFYISHGYMPGIVDHINRDKQDNRIINLREVTASQNQINKRVQENNTSGAKGVSRFHAGNKRWRARIQVEKRNIHLGYYRTLDEAREAYKQASIIYHGEYAGDS